MKSANDPHRSLQPVRQDLRSFMRRDLIETIVANDNEPRSIAESIARMKAAADSVMRAAGP